jgi:hypothetical protein
MSALVLWGGDDHQVRAKALATTYATTAQDVSGKPKKVSGLNTLVFWGHGDPAHFCHLTPDEFVSLVASWKKLNSGLETVEILTCNARHKNGAFTDSYTGQVVTKLTTKHSGIRFKALPVATTKKGATCEWSILKWHDASSTWAYIGAPTYTLGSSSQLDSIMHDAVKLLEDFMPPRGQYVGYARAIAAMESFTGLTTTDLYATKRKWGQADVDNYNKEAKATRENTFIMAGTLSGLRWWTTDIK